MPENNHVVIRLPIPREVHEELHRHCSHAGIKRNALILRLIMAHLKKPTTRTGEE